MVSGLFPECGSAADSYIDQQASCQSTMCGTCLPCERPHSPRRSTSHVWSGSRIQGFQGFTFVLEGFYGFQECLGYCLTAR